MHPQMMVELVQNHERILKFDSTADMYRFGLGNIARDFPTVFLGQSDLQVRHGHAVMGTEGSDGFFSLIFQY